MNLALKQGITNWECSGQGFGGYMDDDDYDNNDDNMDRNNDDNDDDDDDDDNDDHDGIEGRVYGAVKFGVLKDCPQHALDLHHIFFDDRSTHLLYL